jgi:hypothetical protein
VRHEDTLGTHGQRRRETPLERLFDGQHQRLLSGAVVSIGPWLGGTETNRPGVAVPAPRRPYAFFTLSFWPA